MQTDKLLWTVNQDDSKITLQIKGELVRHTLLDLCDQYYKKGFLVELESQAKDLIVNLSQVTRIDCAGFALLCDIIRSSHIQVNGKAHKVRLQDVSSQVLTLADLFGLANWIKSFLYNGK